MTRSGKKFSMKASSLNAQNLFIFVENSQTSKKLQEFEEKSQLLAKIERQSL